MGTNIILAIGLSAVGILSVHRGLRMLRDTSYFYKGRGISGLFNAYIASQPDQEAAQEKMRKPFAYAQMVYGSLWFGLAGYFVYVTFFG